MQCPTKLTSASPPLPPSSPPLPLLEEPALVSQSLVFVFISGQHRGSGQAAKRFSSTQEQHKTNASQTDTRPMLDRHKTNTNPMQDQYKTNARQTKD